MCQKLFTTIISKQERRSDKHSGLILAGRNGGWEEDGSGYRSVVELPKAG